MTLQGYLLISAALFSIGAAGFIARRNLFILLMSVELMLNAVNLSLVAFSRQWRHSDGQIFVLLIIAVAAAEVAVALAAVILYFRNQQTLDVDALSSLGDAGAHPFTLDRAAQTLDREVTRGDIGQKGSHL